MGCWGIVSFSLRKDSQSSDVGVLKTRFFPEVWINLHFLLHRERSVNQYVYMVQGNDRCTLLNTQKYTVWGRYVYISVLKCYLTLCPFQWPRGLRRGSATARLLGLLGSIPFGSMDVCPLWVLVLSGGGLCVGLITRPEESYRVWCVWVWSWIRGCYPMYREEITLWIT